MLEGSRITVSVESRAETAVLVGVPYEASTEYVKLLFSQCGEVTHIHEFSKTKYKIRKFLQCLIYLVSFPFICVRVIFWNLENVTDHLLLHGKIEVKKVSQS